MSTCVLLSSKHSNGPNGIGSGAQAPCKPASQADKDAGPALESEGPQGGSAWRFSQTVDTPTSQMFSAPFPLGPQTGLKLLKSRIHSGHCLGLRLRTLGSTKREEGLPFGFPCSSSGFQPTPPACQFVAGIDGGVLGWFSIHPHLSSSSSPTPKPLQSNQSNHPMP